MASPGMGLPAFKNVSEESYPTPHGAGSPPESRPEALPSYPGELYVFRHMACLRQAFSTM